MLLVRLCPEYVLDKKLPGYQSNYCSHRGDITLYQSLHINYVHRAHTKRYRANSCLCDAISYVTMHEEKGKLGMRNLFEFARLIWSFLWTILFLWTCLSGVPDLRLHKKRIENTGESFVTMRRIPKILKSRRKAAKKEKKNIRNKGGS